MDLDTRKQALFHMSQEAFAVIKAGLNNVKTSQEKSRGDFVTDVDLRAENLILEYLGKNFPNDAIVTEESDDKYGTSGFTWIIDPLDGTNNFRRGVPLAGVQIALLQDGRAVFGLMTNLTDDVVYFAEAGRGALMTDFQQSHKTPISVSKRSLHDSMLVISSNVAHDPSGMQRRILDNVVPHAESFRVLGCAVQEFPYVARGNFEAIISNHPKSMDITAGALLIEEAGGKATTYDGLPWSPDMKTIVASNGVIHDELVELIEKALN